MGGHVFLSYSHLDAAYVGRLKAHLVLTGLAVWTDEGIDFGARWSMVIETQIETCAVFVPVMSSRSREAPWVNREIDLAQELHKPILPLLLEGRRFLQLRDVQDEDVTGGRIPSDRFIEQLHRLTGTVAVDHARVVSPVTQPAPPGKQAQGVPHDAATSQGASGSLRARLRPRAGDGRLEARKVGSDVHALIPLEGGGRLVLEINVEGATILADRLAGMQPHV